MHHAHRLPMRLYSQFSNIRSIDMRMGACESIQVYHVTGHLLKPPGDKPDGTLYRPISMGLVGVIRRYH